MSEEKPDKNTRYYYLGVLAVFLGICSPKLLAYGMFVDGLFYATLAKNMAVGVGSFWQPHFSETLFPVFYEHPQLAIWLQSLAFRVFGDHVMVERLYSLFTMLLVALLTVKIWKRITGEAVTAWFPLLVLISFPAVPWASLNNMLENSMSVFVCGAVWLYLVAVQKNSRIWVALSGLALFLGMFSKGIPALFPLSLPCWIWLFTSRISLKTALLDTVWLLGCALLPFLFLYAWSAEARNFIDHYATTQLLPSVAGTREVSGTRFYIIRKFLEQALIPCAVLAATMLVIMIRAGKKGNLFRVHKNNSLMFLALALCGVLPLMLSLKQNGHYLLPVYPFLALAVALPFQPYLKILMGKVQNSSPFWIGLRVGSCVLLVLALSVTLVHMGKIGRDKELLQVVFECNRHIPRNTVINIDTERSVLWGFHGNFARTRNISLDVNKETKREYYLSNQGIFHDARHAGEGYVFLMKNGNYVLLKQIRQPMAGEPSDSKLQDNQ